MKAKPAAPDAAAKWAADPLDWTRTGGHADRLLAAVDVRKKRQRRRRVAAAGGAAALLLGLFLYVALPHAGTEPALTPTGRALVTTPEHRTLPDGTVVELKPGAELAVNFSATSSNFREVELTKGEALFKVAKNPDRPFVVTAGGVRFRAVGTAFSVDLRSSTVEMLVTEGKVAVEPPVAAGVTASEPMATVEAGHRVEVALMAAAPPPEVVPTSISEAAEKLAWRVPRLEFNETPLWEVVSMLNQYSGARISLANTELGRVEISGSLRADNIEPLLQTLEANYKIQVVRLPGGEIELKQDR